MNITRRSFIVGAAAGVGMGAARAASAEASKGTPNVAFGVLSDVHLNRPGDEDTLLKALAYFMPPTREAKSGHIVFAVSELKGAKEVRFAVRPLECFGHKGPEIYSELYKVS